MAKELRQEGAPCGLTAPRATHCPSRNGDGLPRFLQLGPKEEEVVMVSLGTSKLATLPPGAGYYKATREKGRQLAGQPAKIVCVELGGDRTE